jgi:hypothetical protein
MSSWHGHRFLARGRKSAPRGDGAARRSSVAAAKLSVLFAEFNDQVLLLCPVKKGITGFAFFCFASSPLETM